MGVPQFHWHMLARPSASCCCVDACVNYVQGLRVPTLNHFFYCIPRANGYGARSVGAKEAEMRHSMSSSLSNTPSAKLVSNVYPLHQALGFSAVFAFLDSHSSFGKTSPAHGSCRSHAISAPCPAKQIGQLLIEKSDRSSTCQGHPVDSYAAARYMAVLHIIPKNSRPSTINYFTGQWIVYQVQEISRRRLSWSFYGFMR